MSVTGSSDAELDWVARLGARLTYFEFRSYLARRAQAVDAAPIEVTYERGGVRRSVEDARADSELSRPDSVLSGKLLYFRAVPRDDSCQH